MLGAHDDHRAGRAARTTAFVLFLLLSGLILPGPAYGGTIVKKQLRGSIVNGTANGAPIGWQVGLVPVGTDGGVKVPFEVFCGGTIRDATHIVTAAHCVPDSNAAEVAVVANLNNRSDGVNAGAQVRVVSAITSHPLFRGVETGNDLAILTLSEPLPTVVPTWPITNPNPNPNNDWVGAPAAISGWGLLFDRGPSPDALQRAFIQVLPNQSCANYAEGFSPATMLCAGLPNGLLTVDTCQGDSGGPLVFNNGTTFPPLIGVVSFGRGCADPNFPGIYTRLSNPDLNARVKAANPPPRAEPTGGATVQGTATVGQTLTCNPGQWTLPATFTFSWRSAKLGADGKPTDVRSEGPGPTLALTAAHADRVVGCAATATTTNDGGSRESGAKPVAVSAPAAAAAPPPVALPSDLVAPTSRFSRRACARRRCSLTIIATDSGGAATSATVTYQRITGCRKGRKGARCRKAKRLKVKSRSPGVFTVRTPKLTPASYRFTVIAVDASGNRSRATSVVLRVRR